MVGERAKYRIVLLDDRGQVTGESVAETIAAARVAAKHLISDEYAQITESSHDSTVKAEVLDEEGDCVYDIFR